MEQHNKNHFSIFCPGFGAEFGFCGKQYPLRSLQYTEGTYFKLDDFLKSAALPTP